jgi:hypothetical protein
MPMEAGFTAGQSIGGHSGGSKNCLVINAALSRELRRSE